MTARDDWFTAPSGDLELFEELPRFPVPGLRGGVEGGLVAPMPGKVLSTECTSPRAIEVEQGQLLLVLEAMKMEHRVIVAPAGRHRGR